MAEHWTVVRSSIQATQAARQQTLAKWGELKTKAGQRRKLLEDSRDAHRLLLDVAEVQKWVTERQEKLAQPDEALYEGLPLKIKNHKAFEAEVQATQQSFQPLLERGEGMMAGGHFAANRIQEALDLVTGQLRELEAATAERRRQLDEARANTDDYTAFSSRLAHLQAWITETTRLLSSLATPEDLSGVESLVEQHEEQKREIDARHDLIQTAVERGDALIQTTPYAASEITLKLEGLQEDYAVLLEVWSARKVEFQEARLLQGFCRDASLVDAWLDRSCELFSMDELGDSLDEVNTLLKKHDTFRRSTIAFDERLRMLLLSEGTARTQQHSGLAEFTDRCVACRQRYDDLVSLCEEKAALLQESLDLQLLFRDIREAHLFIEEKRAVALDQSYLDPSNLSGKQRKFEAFRAEISANEARFSSIAGTGGRLIAADHFAADVLQEMLDALATEHQQLLAQADDKGRKLKEALAHYTFYQDVGSLKSRLAVVHAFAESADTGLDLSAVNQLIKRQRRMETAYASDQEPLRALVSEAKLFADEEYFDADTSNTRCADVVGLYEALQSALALRAAALGDSREVHLYLNRVRDDIAWVQSKEALVASTDSGDSLLVTQSLELRLKAIEAEIERHGPMVQAVLDDNARALLPGHACAGVAEALLDQLQREWVQLQAHAEGRRKRLVEAMDKHLFDVDAREIDFFIHEHMRLAQSIECGENEDAALNLMAKHDTLATAVRAYQAQMSAFSQERDRLVDGGSAYTADVLALHDRVAMDFEDLLTATSTRTKALQHAVQLRQFEREAETVLEWLERGRDVAAASDTGDNGEECSAILKRFENFRSDITPDRVDALTALAKTLCEQGHPQLETIRARSSTAAEQWVDLQRAIQQLEETLQDALLIHSFQRDCGEATEWLEEKQALLMTDDLGVDVSSVEVLERNHDNVARDVAALSRQIEAVAAKADQLLVQFPKRAAAIQAEKDHTMRLWGTVQSMADTRRGQLEESRAFHAFLADLRELQQYYAGVLEGMHSFQAPRDVTEAESNLEQHHEFRLDIDAQGGTHSSVVGAGEAMIAEAHSRAEEVKTELAGLEDVKVGLEQLWATMVRQLEESVAVQHFVRRTTEFEAWMAAAQMQFLASEDLGDSVDSVDALIKKQEELEKSMFARGLHAEEIDSNAGALTSGSAALLPTPAGSRRSSATPTYKPALRHRVSRSPARTSPRTSLPSSPRTLTPPTSPLRGMASTALPVSQAVGDDGFV